MKKGFTLVELLAVIVILSVIAIMVFPNVIQIINESKENLYQTQLRDIENVTKSFVMEHPELMDSHHLNTIYITLEALKKGGYLEMDKISNPKTSEEMNGCVKIIYNDSHSQYNYTYEEIDCVADTTLSGYIITYSDTFLKEERNALIPAYDKILADYEGLISTVGGVTDGLYDMGEEYIFRGGTTSVGSATTDEGPRNYVKLGTGGDSYRIISMNKEDKTIKLIKVSPESSAYSQNNSNVFIESAVATYLLDFLSTGSISSFANKVVDEVKWKNGKLDITSTVSYDVLKSIEATSSVSNKLGLINISDYVIASLSETCYQDVYNTECTSDNYLADLFGSNYVWTMDSSTTGKIITIENGTITDHTLSTNDSTYRIYPVVVLKSNFSISTGSGTSSSPYIFH